MGRTTRLAVMVAACITLAGATATSAVGREYAPLDQPGPKLDVPRKSLDASLNCPTRPSRAKRPVVLLVPGTTVDPPESFSWNYEKALASNGIPFCDVTVPNHTDGDIQVAAEYVVDAVRRIHRQSGRKVQLFGWSQGASTLPRWALRFWPDVRHKVSSLVGLAPLNNRGSVVATAPCVIQDCIPAAWQQAVGSNFMAALNSRRQVFDGIDYTAIYTRFDDVVTPNVDGSLSRLPAGPNTITVAVQDICPTDVSDHLAIIASPGAYAVAIDALKHPFRPAKLSRVKPSSPCLPGTMPGVDPFDFATQEAKIGANVGPHLATGIVPSEPKLRRYVFAR